MPPVTAFDVRKFIDEQPVGRYQLMVATMCSLIVFVDGFDAQAMGYVAPALSAAMQIPRSVLGPVIRLPITGAGDPCSSDAR
jgi:MFS transporter, AAHS family, 4-hydroxybenzoate transporter